MNVLALPTNAADSRARPVKRWRAPDLVKRQFPATRLNHKWYGDGTEIGTDEGKLHLVSVMEAASRRVLGFTLSEHHDAAAAYRALAGPARGLTAEHARGVATPMAARAADGHDGLTGKRKPASAASRGVLPAAPASGSTMPSRTATYGT